MRELIDELAAARGVAGVRGRSVKNRIHNFRERVNGLAAEHGRVYTLAAPQTNLAEADVRGFGGSLAARRGALSAGSRAP